jgi:hypothetical protein
MNKPNSMLSSAPAGLHVDVWLEGHHELWRLDEPTLKTIGDYEVVLPPDLNVEHLQVTRAMESADRRSLVLLLQEPGAAGAAGSDYVAVFRRYVTGQPPVCVFFHQAVGLSEALNVLPAR